jgi:hypothetical protein
MPYMQRVVRELQLFCFNSVPFCVYFLAQGRVLSTPRSCSTQKQH